MNISYVDVATDHIAPATPFTQPTALFQKLPASVSTSAPTGETGLFRREPQSD
ncbi:hypothetical protein HYT84_03745 [Candidatus Micrarchaeota archaeon]|nr:hypothetical protein [Candidatus Micrarchaeota archaeon]